MFDDSPTWLSWQPLMLHPELIPLVEKLLSCLSERYPDAPVTVQKTQIKLGYGGGFCWLSTRGRRLIFSFTLRRPLEDERILQCVQTTKTRWMLHTAADAPACLDETMLKWLDEGWEENQVHKGNG